MTARRIAARLAAAIVALVAGAASYQHIAAVALSAGEPPWVAYSLPLAIDGLIVVGVAALLEDKAANLRPRRSAWLAVIVGVAATLAANVASAEPTVTARLVAAAAPVAFLISVEVLTGRGRPVSDSARPPTEQGAEEAPAKPADSKPVTSENAAKSTQAAQKQPTHTRTPRRRGATAQRVARAVADSPHATTAELAAQLGVSARTIQRYRRELSATANGYGGPVVMSPRTDS